MSLREEIGAILDAAGIRHALVGALALAAYGVNRASPSFKRRAAGFRKIDWDDGKRFPRNRPPRG